MTAFDLFLFDAAEEDADVVAGDAFIQRLLELLDAGDGRGLGVAEADDLDRVADLRLAALDTAGGDGAAALDREDVFDGHQKRLVDLALRDRDVLVQGRDQLVDRLAGLVVLGGFQGRLGVAANDRGIVAGEVVLIKQLAHFHLDQLEQLGVVHEVNLIQEDDDLGHADLTGQQDVLAGLGHGTVGSRHDQNRAVHLGGAGDHVLDVVRVTGTVHVGVVPRFGLIFHVRGGDRHRLGGVAIDAALGDVLVVLGGHVGILRRCPRRKGGGQGRLAVVDVTDGAHVDVGLFTLEYALSHCRNLQVSF